MYNRLDIYNYPIHDQAREFLDLAWMKDDKETRAPNIIRMVRWSNHVVHWLITEIVTIKDNIKLRAAMMEKIIALAQVQLIENLFRPS